MNIKEAAHRIALDHVALTWEEKLPKGTITKEHEDTFRRVLDDVNNKKIDSADDFYTQLDTLGIDKHMLRDLVSRVISKGKSDEIVKMVFLLGQGRPLGESSSGKGLKILTDTWIKRQLDDNEIIRRVKPKFWPLFREKSWIEKEQQGIDKEKSI